MLNRHGLSGLPGVELDNEMLLYRNINLLTKRQGFHPTRPAVGIQFQPLGNTLSAISSSNILIRGNPGCSLLD